ncbi:hypothetical protein K2Z83_06015 [Oscillochloris sp. ZM17-4]|uniref:hypothetical protein n=1 Tax=Oscillochloris sp. ZM17-4 TaxID=2866714 RepID=UPI001C73AC14|nr:hypothetical protein [Oscillochloris sp. ZM17-4]MBX0327235.1 hypothetical protein [Oscillochloris sp. ZM17-4]
MRKYIPLIILVGVALLPYGLVAQQSPALEYLFYKVFDGLPAHIVGHAAIFAAIGTLALKHIPALRGRPAAYAALILLVALGQEGLQVIYKGHLYLGDTLGDLLVDLIAAAAVFATWWQATRSVRAQQRGAAAPQQ